MRSFIMLLLAFVVGVFVDPALAAEEGASMGGGLLGIGAGIGMGIAAFGAGLGQGRATGAALESIGRNPSSADQVFTPLILGLALMESLALYTLVIAFLLLGKI